MLVGVGAVDREPVVRVAEDRGVAERARTVEAAGILMVVVAAARGGMPQAGIEARPLHDDRVLVPDVLVVVGARVEGVERGNTVPPHGGGPERGRGLRTGVDHRGTRNLEKVVLVARSVRVPEPGTDRIGGNARGVDVHVSARVAHSLNVRRDAATSCDTGGVLKPRGQL